MADSVQIELEVLARAALDSVKSFQRNAQKSLDSINFNTTVSAIEDGFRIIERVAGPVFDVLKEGFSRAIEEGLQFESEQFKLANALRLTGDAGGDAIGRFNDLADSLQRTTSFSGGAVISAVALAKQYQLTNKEAEKVIRVSADLAAATGTDLDTAVRTVAQSYNGFVDRSLAKVIPGLKNLSSEALLNGAALGQIEARVKGTAEALGNTLAGSLAKVKNSSDDVFESLGRAFSENAGVKASVDVLNQIFVELNDKIKANEQAFRDIVSKGIILLAQSLPILTRGIEATISGFTKLYFSVASTIRIVQALTALTSANTDKTALLNISEDLDKIGKSAGEALNSQEDFFSGINDLADEVSKRVSEAAKDTTKLKTETLSAGKSLTGFGQRAAGFFDPQQVAAYKRQVQALGDTLSDQVKNDVKTKAAAPISALIEFSIKGQEELDKAKRKLDQQIAEITNNKAIPQSIKDQARAIGDTYTKEIEAAAKRGNFAGIANQLTAALKNGAQGAQQLIVETSKGLGEQLGEGLGGPIGNIVELFSQGPEQVKKIVTSFIEAIPTILVNIVESIPDLLVALFEKLPVALVSAIPKLIEALITGIVQRIPEIIAAFIKGIVSAAGALVQALIDGIKSLFNGLLGLGDSDSIFAGVPILQGIGDFFGFAEGGRIPDLPKYEGDRAPARLSAGEQVFDKDLTSKLERFLAGDSSAGGATQVVLKIGQSELAKVMLDLNRGGFRTS